MRTIPTALMTHPPTPDWAAANEKVTRDAEAKRGPRAPLRFDDGSDLVDRLSPRAAKKLKALRQEVAELFTLSQAEHDDQQELIQDRQKAAARIAELTDPDVAARMGRNETCSLDHPSVLSARAEHDKLTAKLEAIGARQKARATRRNAIGNLLLAVEAYAARLSPDVQATAVEIDPSTFAPGELPAQAVEDTRRRRRELLVDLRAVETAPVHSSIVKAKVRAEIEAIAERGEPDLYRLLEGGDAIRWPQNFTRLDITAVAMVEGAPFVKGTAGGNLPDVLAIDIWRNKAAWITRLEKLVDEIADDANALSDKERAARSADILDRILVVERHEEALTETAGGDILRRPDLDPRAFLGIEGPAPKGERR